MKQILCTVVGCALGGMGMGGLFGWGAGAITPDLFRQAIPWWNIEPVGLAVFLGATAGVVLGGGLGCFAVLVHAVFNREKPRIKLE